MTRPTAQILSDKGISVTVGRPADHILVCSANRFLACRTLESAKKLAQGLKNVHSTSVDVSDDKALDQEVAKVDLVISLIPYTYHATVVKSAIRNKKDVVTTSYVSPAMMELDQEAKEAGITVMNEIGLDPGIDHLWAIKTIHEVHQAHGKIKGFISYVGGLP